MAAEPLSDWTQARAMLEEVITLALERHADSLVDRLAGVQLGGQSAPQRTQQQLTEPQQEYLLEDNALEETSVSSTINEPDASLETLCRPGFAVSLRRCQVAPGSAGHMHGLKKSPSEVFSDVYSSIAQEEEGFLLHKARVAMQWWKGRKSRQAQRMDRFIDSLVQSLWFQMAVCLVIFANMGFTIYEINVRMSNRISGAVDPDPEWWSQLDLAFTVSYIVELLLRFGSEGKYFFMGENMAWNWFDLMVLCGPLFSASHSWFRALKVLKIARAARVAKLVRILGLREISIMMKQVTGSVMTLLLCLCVLTFITLMFSLFFMFTLLEDTVISPGDSVLEMFASVDQSFVTLLMATTGGVDWGDIFDRLEPAGAYVAAFFIGYVIFFFIALWNIVTATFINKMMQCTKQEIAEDELDDWLHDLQQGPGEKGLREIFRELRVEGSGRNLSENEFVCWQDKIDSIRDRLRERGVNVKEACAFFATLFESGRVKELHKGTLAACCRRIKGQAMSIDLHTMRYELTCMLATQEKMLHTIGRTLTQKQPAASERSL